MAASSAAASAELNVQGRCIFKRVQPFLETVCGKGLARVVATVLLVTDKLCGIVIPRQEIMKGITAALDDDDEFALKATLGGALRAVLRCCFANADRPLSVGHRKLSKLLQNAVTLFSAYDPLHRGGNDVYIVLSMKK